MSKPTDAEWGALRVWWLPYLGLVAVHLLVGGNGYYPTLHPDEVIYREMARYFSGIGPVPSLSDTFVFPLGYPLLIAPVYRLFEDENALGFALLFVNSLLASAVVFPVIVFVRRILGASRRAAVYAALAVGVYPAYLVIAGMTLTQHAFVPLYAALVVLAWSLYRRPAVPLAALLGAGTAVLYAIHERALLVMAVAVAQLVFLAAIGQLRKHVAAVAIAVAAGGFVAVRQLMTHVHVTLYQGAGVERPLGKVLSKLLDVDGWVDVFLQTAGQAWYLLVATYGLFGVGVTLLVKLAWVRRADLWRRGPGTAAAHCVLFLLLTALAIFGTCAVYFPANPIMSASSEFYFFGRINEGFLALFLAAGLAALFGPANGLEPATRRSEGLRSALKTEVALPVSLLVMCLLGVVMVWGRGMAALAEDPRTYGVFGVRWFLRDNVWRIHPVVGTVVLAVACFLIYRALRRRPPLAVGAVVLAFLVLSTDLSIHYFGRRQQRQYRRSLPALAAAAGGIDAIAMDASETRFGRWADMIRRVEIRNFDDSRGETPAAPVVITERRWKNGERRGARFLAGDRDVDYALWVLPGPEQERLFQPPDYRTVTFGAQSIWSVWERSFTERELWRGPEPMRWTQRRSYLRIPLQGRPSPVLLHVDVAATAQRKTRFDVEANGRELVETDIPHDGWSGTFSLEGVEMENELLVRLKSTVSRFAALLYGSPRPYDRGVLLRGLYLFDAEEAAAIAAGLEGGSPPRYRLSLDGRPALTATRDDPLVLRLRLENAGDRAWPGRLGGEGTRAPQIVARWHPAAGGPSRAEVRAEVGRPVLPGRELRLAVAIAARDDTGSALSPGAYELRLALASPDADPAGGDRSEPLVLPVEVSRPAAKFFAPVRLLAWRVTPSDPPFTLTPF